MDKMQEALEWIVTESGHANLDNIKRVAEEALECMNPKLSGEIILNGGVVAYSSMDFSQHNTRAAAGRASLDYLRNQTEAFVYDGTQMIFNAHSNVSLTDTSKITVRREAIEDTVKFFLANPKKTQRLLADHAYTIKEAYNRVK